MIRPDHKAQLARAVLAFRRARSDELPAGIFGEVGWEFLLELFIANANGERLTGWMVVERSSVTPTTASRWLRYLSQEGLVVGDGDGDLSDLLTLSHKAVECVERLMARAEDLFRDLVANRN